MGTCLMRKMNCTVKYIEDVACVKLCSDSGVQAELLSFGAALRTFAASSEGKIIPLTLTFAGLEEYTVRNTASCGKTLAPNAGEVEEAAGILLTDGSVIHPTANKERNSLHGGAHAGSVQNWELADAGTDGHTAFAQFDLTLPDGLDGWPGERIFHVRYSLLADDSLQIDLSATTDRPTYINMSNHAYWDLEQDPAAAADQWLSINAQEMWLNDANAIPEQTVSLEKPREESGIDLRGPFRMRDLLTVHGGCLGRQIELGKGLDNAFRLRTGRSFEEPACSLESADRRQRLDLFTDAPDLVVYMAGTIQSGILLENGRNSEKHCAVALEAQEIPNGKVNRALLPGETFHRMIRFHHSFY